MTFFPKADTDTNKVSMLSKPEDKLRTWGGCSHWQSKFQLLDGLTILASAIRDEPKTASGKERYPSVTPDLGFYLAPHWMSYMEVLVSEGFSGGPTISETYYPQACYDWPDFGVPPNINHFITWAQWVLEEIRSGKVVETGCYGAHGRTGTFLACLLVLQGALPGAAVGQVRNTHCKKAIETQEQCEFVKRIFGAVWGPDTLGEINDEGDEKAFNLERSLSGGAPGRVSGAGTSFTKPAEGAWTSISLNETDNVKVVAEERRSMGPCAHCGHDDLEHDVWFGEVASEWCGVNAGSEDGFRACETYEPHRNADGEIVVAASGMICESEDSVCKRPDLCDPEGCFLGTLRNYNK